MSILLKTNLDDLDAPQIAALQHDALAAHAMQMAEDAAYAHFADVSECDPTNVIDWINERAAANLARLMGEGNGN
jgi:hypothetical protein